MMYADLVLCEDSEAFLSKCAFFLMILKSEYLSTFNLSSIRSLCKANKVRLEHIDIEEMCESEIDLAKKPDVYKCKENFIYSKNKITRAILQKMEKRESLNDQAATSFKNPFKNDKLFDYFLKKNVPFCIAWGSFFSEYSTNNVAEG